MTKTLSVMAAIASTLLACASVKEQYQRTREACTQADPSQRISCFRNRHQEVSEPLECEAYLPKFRPCGPQELAESETVTAIRIDELYLWTGRARLVARVTGPIDPPELLCVVPDEKNSGWVRDLVVVTAVHSPNPGIELPGRIKRVPAAAVRGPKLPRSTECLVIEAREDDSTSLVRGAGGHTQDDAVAGRNENSVPQKRVPRNGSSPHDKDETTADNDKNLTADKPSSSPLSDVAQDDTATPVLTTRHEPLPVASSDKNGVGTPISERPVVAVFDVEDPGKVLPRAVNVQFSDYMAGRVAAAPGYRVVPRAELRRHLWIAKKESYRPCYDEACQIELGKGLAAQKTISTKILRIGALCVLQGTLFDLRLETSEAAGSVETECDIDSIRLAVSSLLYGILNP